MGGVRESQAAQAEAGDGDERFGPSIGFGGVLRGGAAKAEEDSVSGLHGNEGAEGIVDSTIDESGNIATAEKEDVGVYGADYRGPVTLAAVEDRLWRSGDVGLVQGRKGCRYCFRGRLCGLVERGYGYESIGIWIMRGLHTAWGVWIHSGLCSVGGMHLGAAGLEYCVVSGDSSEYFRRRSLPK